MPATISVPLNSRLEKSSVVPSALKCRCHHHDARVVRIEASVPLASTTATVAAIRCALAAASIRCVALASPAAIGGRVAVSVSDVIWGRGCRGTP
ncbi:MAG TPA: hypothetical protein VFN24_06520 [Microbacterium sp.]|nr:hypothetical protein [Microbacterium sp.]